MDDLDEAFLAGMSQSPPANLKAESTNAMGEQKSDRSSVGKLHSEKSPKTIKNKRSSPRETERASSLSPAKLATRSGSSETPRKVKKRTRASEITSLPTKEGESFSHFASRLLLAATKEEWEEMEIGRLIRLFCAEWDFESKQTYHFLEDCCPELVSSDMLEGLSIDLGGKRLLKLLRAASRSYHSLVRRLSDLIEGGYLDLTDSSILEKIASMGDLSWDDNKLVDFAISICACIDSTRTCAMFLKALSEPWDTERARGILRRVFDNPLFLDMRGDVHQIFSEYFEDMEDTLKALIPQRESDEDSEGNLNGFVVSDSEEGSSSSGEEGKSNGSMGKRTKRRLAVVASSDSDSGTKRVKRLTKVNNSRKSSGRTSRISSSGSEEECSSNRSSTLSDSDLGETYNASDDEAEQENEYVNFEETGSDENGSSAEDDKILAATFSQTSDTGEESE